MSKLTDKIASDCARHKYVGMDGICLATECIVRKNNIENEPGECKFYKFIFKDKNGKWHLKKDK